VSEDITQTSSQSHITQYTWW